MTIKSARIASIGECMLELSRDGDRWAMKYAGDTLNTLWAIRALLPSTAVTDYVTAFGTDPFSDQQIAFLNKNGIGTGDSPRLEAFHPGLYAITLDGAERSFTYWRNQSAARHLADDANALAGSLNNRDLIYFSGITLAILEADARETLLAALKTARAKGAKIAFDANYRPRLWTSRDEAQAAIGKALTVVDIALPTFDDEQALYGDADASVTAARLADAGVQEAVIKHGADPACLSENGQLSFIPAVRVEKPLDTTGAGDSFNGGYLAARINGQSPRDAVVWAHRSAARTVQEYGALAPMERLRQAVGEA